MKIIIRSDSVYIDGYVNAVERNSKPLNERGVRFIERIGAGAFSRALERASDVRILLNHREDRDLGSIKEGNLTLQEDNIGLRAQATITDKEVIKDAREGNLVGWSFGFTDLPNGVTQLRDEESGLPLRKVTDLNLFEVSLLNREKTPAYSGTLVNVRDDGSEEKLNINYSEENSEANEVVNEVEESPEADEKRDASPDGENSEETASNIEESKEDPKPEEAPEVREVSSDYYARYKNIIKELRENSYSKNEKKEVNDNV